MGSIYKRGSRYWIKFRDERGRLVRKSAGNSQDQALKLLEKMEEDSSSSAERTLLRDLTKPYLEALEIRGKERSVTSARASISTLLENLPSKDVSGLTPADLNRFIAFRKKTVRDIRCDSLSSVPPAQEGQDANNSHQELAGLTRLRHEVNAVRGSTTHGPRIYDRVAPVHQCRLHVLDPER